jgi:tRNA A64-2'-O-ribosylphosphate transferase
VEAIVSASTAISIKDDWVTLPNEILKTAGKLLICSNANLPSPLPSSFLGTTIGTVPAAFLQICAPGELALPHTHQLPDFRYPNYVRLEAPEGKRGQSQFLQNVLPESMSFISNQLRMGSSVCIACGTGKDKSVGVALAALQKFFDDTGSFVQEDTTRAPREFWNPACGICMLNKAVNVANKLSIKTRLQWIISSHPQANPSRTTLKRVNEFLLTSAFLNHSTPISFSPAPASL